MLIIIEIIYVIFNFYYFVKLLITLKSIWVRFTKREKHLPVPPRATKLERILLYTGIDYSKYQKKSIVSLGTLPINQ